MTPKLWFTALTIYEEVIFGNILAGLDSGTSVITQMEDPGFDTQPVEVLANSEAPFAN